jgi:SagB-type dehydrogenase family enzyme
MPKMIRRHPAMGPATEEPAESLAELYHENSKWRRLPGARVQAVVEFTPTELRAMARAFRHYRLHPHIALPPPDTWPEPGLTFDEVVEARRSGRDFSDAPIDLAGLAKMLHQAVGITGQFDAGHGIVRPLRAAPSAGGLYPTELYLVVHRVAGLEPGLYHYNVPQHAVALLSAGDVSDAVCAAFAGQESARGASFVVIIAGIMGRTRRKYGERGYRYVLMEAGHLAQNLLLSATALGYAAFTTGGFFDEYLNALLRLDGIDETVLYCALVGQPGATEVEDLRSRLDDTGAHTDH